VPAANIAADMDDQRVGRTVRALRRRLGWRQADVAAASGVSQDAVSRVELGRVAGLSLRSVRRIASALDADAVITFRWRGGDLDRLLDEGHAALLGAVTGILARHGWVVQPEVTYSIFGERGSVDILAWHAPTRTLLVVEVKTELTSIEETLRRHDVKARLAPQIAANRFGWRPRAVGRLLVLPALSTPRRRVGRHAAVLDRAYPARGAQVRAWMRAPVSYLNGILFVPLTRQARARDGGVSRKRVRRPRAGSPTR
jgi:transcriptional regulator with XRE-family HTH domain